MTNLYIQYNDMSVDSQPLHMWGANLGMYIIHNMYIHSFIIHQYFSVNSVVRRLVEFAVDRSPSNTTLTTRMGNHLMTIYH